MKLSFSLRGWLSLSFREAAEIAEEMQFSGFELYDLHKYSEPTVKGGPLDRYSMSGTMRSLRDKGIEIANLDTSLDLGREGSLEKVFWTIRMAKDMRVPFVSAEVMTDNEDLVKESLRKIVEAATEANVTFLLKTRGIYVDTGRLKDILDLLAEDCLTTGKVPIRQSRISADMSSSSTSVTLRKTVPIRSWVKENCLFPI